MGTDYGARKAAKRRRKGNRAAAGSAEGTVDAEELDGLANLEDNDGKRRERKKRPKVRRFCKGMCYGTPEAGLEGEMVATAGNASDDNGGGGGGGAPQPEQPAGRRRSKRREPPATADVKAHDNRNLSTEVGVASFVPKANAKDAGTAASDELKKHPHSFQRFMLAEGHPTPTPIQSTCWPVLTSGRDSVVLAPTGSGKTIAFLLPVLTALESRGLLGSTSPEGPLAIVLAPTREVAQQTARAARPLRSLFKLRSVTLFGGVPKEEQAKLLATKPHLVVASPGRLLDLMDDGALSLGHVVYVVLDEADKLLSAGFEEQLERIRLAAGIVAPAAEAKKPKQRRHLVVAPELLSPQTQRPRPQVCLCSATMPDAVEEVAARWLVDAERLHTAAENSISTEISQVVQVCAEHKKPKKLLKHLHEVYAGKGPRNPPRVLIFANRLKTVRFLFKTLTDAKYRVAMLHGERSQPEREEAMTAFRAGKATVMVATDVASRGLHIAGLPFIVNYDFPSNIETYVHRVGRTGRLAANGHSFSFFTRTLARLAPPVVALLKANGCALDPNLVALSEAWKEALARDPELAALTGDFAESDGGEDEAEAEVEADTTTELAPAEELPQEEDDSAAGQTGKSKRRKALPGRLRKKLAKDKKSRAG